MKKMTCIVLTTALTTTGCNSQSNLPPEVQDALRYGAMAKMTIQVSDERGKSVTNANVSVAYREKEEIKSNHGITGAEGVHIAEVKSQRSGIEGVISQNGFYRSSFKFPFVSDRNEMVKNGRWQPWNPTIPVILRDIRNPIPMYVAWVEEWELPNDTDVGFDFEKGDFVEPYGKGKLADFKINVASKGTPYVDVSSRLRLSASEEGGGFIRMNKIMWSEFVSEYEAPENGYVPVIQTTNRSRRPYDEDSADDVSGGEYLIFKSRIVRDAEGNIVSANYGKLYGNLGYGVGNNPHEKSARFQKNTSYGGVKFPYYFNPTPNDRNIEFDGKDPLFKTTDRRKPHEWSREP